SGDMDWVSLSTIKRDTKSGEVDIILNSVLERSWRLPDTTPHN
ncbi:hypothetical protein SARC_12306, partial [Sphaeroforma arctica JP610]